MVSWAKEQAAQIISRRAQDDENTSERIRLNEILRNDSQIFFQTLGQQIKQHVSEFNDALGQPSALRCCIDGNRITLEKESFPRVSVVLTLRSAPIDVSLYRVKKQSVFSSREEHADGTLRFSLDRNGQISLQGNDPDTVARQVLEQFPDAFKPNV